VGCGRGYEGRGKRRVGWMGVLGKQGLDWIGLDVRMRSKSKSERSRGDGEVECIADISSSTYLPVVDFEKPGWS
jgi:hypothetical protein